MKLASKGFFAVSSGSGFHIQGHLKGLPRRSPLGVSATHPNPVWHPKEPSLRPPIPPLLHLFLQTCTRPSWEPQGIRIEYLNFFSDKEIELGYFLQNLFSFWRASVVIESIEI